MVYQNAPIVEAIFDIRVSALNIKDLHELNVMQALLLNDFVKSSKLYVEGNIQLQSKDKIEEPNFVGYTMHSKDDSRQLQIRFDGLTYNVLKPYENWDTHFSNFMNYWSVFNKTFNPEKITRIAARYLNKFDIPLPFSNYKKYIKNPPTSPQFLKDQPIKFFEELEIPFENKRVIISQSLDPPQFNEQMVFMLDIGVYNYENIVNDDIELKNLFTDLRILKNKIFNECLTENAKSTVL